MNVFEVENGHVTRVWLGRDLDSFPADQQVGKIETEEDVSPGMAWTGFSLAMPAPDLAMIEARTLDQWASRVAAARAAIAGTSDPAKLAEYADKAANAQAVIDGTATAAMEAEAELEAQSLNLEHGPAVAALWLEKAEALRAARRLINKLDREERDAIRRRSSVDGYAEALRLATEALDGLMAQLQAEA